MSSSDLSTMEKPRKRKVNNGLKGSVSFSSENMCSEDYKSQGTSINGEESNELEYLEVKHVVIILLIVFVLFFTGTFLFLNAINSTRLANSSYLPSSQRTSDFSNFPNSKNYEESIIPSEDTYSGTHGKTGVNTELKDLDLPTIIWWTDLLYPHSLSGTPATKIKCDVGTCFSTKQKEYLAAPNTRGIMFYGTDFRAYEAPLPRQKWHEWALLHEESPMNNYVLSSAVMMRLFNHTGTFRRESHFPITTNGLPSLAYLTERQPVPLSTKNELRKEPVRLAPIAYIQSHCDVSSDRDRYVKELMKHIEIDSYGTCLNNKKLPPNLQDPVQSMFSEEFYDFIARYKFHLAFENAICEDYITEKLFRPFHLGSVPIHMGSATVRDWAPSDPSLILVDDFESPKDLADFIKALDRDDREYEKYLQFKKTGVQNKLLKDTMRDRNWGVNVYKRHSFITAFECHLCDKIYERWDLERRKEKEDHTLELPEPRMGSYNHMGCPEPSVSLGEIDDTKRDEDIHSWIHDYWSMQDQAVALDRMIRDGYTDISQFFDVLQKIYRERGRG